MKTTMLFLLILAGVVCIASCSKSAASSGQTCKCQGGLGGGMTKGMDSLSHTEAASRCSSYNGVGNDAFYNCHLE